MELFTSFPERFAERRQVSALGADGQRRELVIEDFWPHKGRLVLKFAGVDSIGDAEALVGTEIQVPREQRATLAANEAYVSDLVGCTVLAGEQPQEVGRVEAVDFSAGEAPLLVVKGGGREFLIPFAASYLKRLDVAAQRIEMTLPEGMLELDAPVGRGEHKRRQRGKD